MSVGLAESGVHLIDLTMGEDPLYGASTVEGDRLPTAVSSRRSSRWSPRSGGHRPAGHGLAGVVPARGRPSPPPAPSRIRAIRRSHARTLFERLRRGQELRRARPGTARRRRLGMLVEAARCSASARRPPTRVLAVDGDARGADRPGARHDVRAAAGDAARRHAAERPACRARHHRHHAAGHARASDPRVARRRRHHRPRVAHRHRANVVTSLVPPTAARPAFRSRSSTSTRACARRRSSPSASPRPACASPRRSSTPTGSPPRAPGARRGAPPARRAAGATASTRCAARQRGAA